MTWLWQRATLAAVLVASLIATGMVVDPGRDSPTGPTVLAATVGQRLAATEDVPLLAAPPVPPDAPPAVPDPDPGPPLPIPEQPPADPRNPEPDVSVGTIAIPKIGLAESLREGVSLTQIDRGPTHWPGTAMPGQLGNVVVAGHRSTYTQPFRDLDDLVPGDRVEFTTADGAFGYEVVGTQIVTPEAIEIIDQTPAHTATIFACHPPGSAEFRIVVSLRLVEPARPPPA
ncbi:hypothetical protein BH24ACT3_BH24ACT3_12880 [soil metagenome]